MSTRRIVAAVVALFLFSTFTVAVPANGRTTTTTSSFKTSSSSSSSSTKTTSSAKTTSSTTKTTSSATSTSTTYNTFAYDATFDDITNSDDVAPTQFINVYKSLYWQAFTLDTLLVNPPPTGVIPNSGNQQAVFGGTLQATQGQAEMTVDYETSTILFFHLYSFYYGCTLATKEGVTGDPTACTINLVATDVNGKTLATQSFSYSPTGLVAQMSYASLSSAFQNQNVYTITFTLSNVTPGTVDGLLDSVMYTVFGSGAISGNS